MTLVIADTISHDKTCEMIKNVKNGTIFLLFTLDFALNSDPTRVFAVAL